MATAKYYMDNGQGNQLTLLATKEISKTNRLNELQGANR